MFQCEITFFSLISFRLILSPIPKLSFLLRFLLSVQPWELYLWYFASTLSLIWAQSNRKNTSHWLIQRKHHLWMWKHKVLTISKQYLSAKREQQFTFGMRRFWNVTFFQFHFNFDKCWCCRSAYVGCWRRNHNVGTMLCTIFLNILNQEHDFFPSRFEAGKMNIFFCYFIIVRISQLLKPLFMQQLWAGMHMNAKDNNIVSFTKIYERLNGNFDLIYKYNV